MVETMYLVNSDNRLEIYNVPLIKPLMFIYQFTNLNICFVLIWIDGLLLR